PISVRGSGSGLSSALVNPKRAACFNAGRVSLCAVSASSANSRERAREYINWSDTIRVQRGSIKDWRDAILDEMQYAGAILPSDLPLPRFLEKESGNQASGIHCPWRSISMGWKLIL